MQKFLGWISLLLMFGISCFWAFWGVMENFHEGWYYTTLTENIMLMFVQYLSPLLICLILSLVACLSPRVAGLLYWLVGLAFTVFIFYTRYEITMPIVLSWLPVLVPLFIIGLGLYQNQMPSRKVVFTVAILMPLILAISLAIPPLRRIDRRSYDNTKAENYHSNVTILLQYDEKSITMEETLLWAPEGPGWNKIGDVTFAKANEICSRLSEDGKKLEEKPVYIWRLPSVDEVVQSQEHDGKSCGGTWDNKKEIASYDFPPDKEYPLWEPYSPVIYWWTSSQRDSDKKVYMVVYHGQVHARNPNTSMGSLGFRAVKKIKITEKK